MHGDQEQPQGATGFYALSGLQQACVNREIDELQAKILADPEPAKRAYIENDAGAEHRFLCQQDIARDPREVQRLVDKHRAAVGASAGVSRAQG